MGGLGQDYSQDTGQGCNFRSGIKDVKAPSAAANQAQNQAGGGGIGLSTREAEEMRRMDVALGLQEETEADKQYDHGVADFGLLNKNVRLKSED